MKFLNVSAPMLVKPTALLNNPSYFSDGLKSVPNMLIEPMALHRYKMDKETRGVALTSIITMYFNSCRK